MGHIFIGIPHTERQAVMGPPPTPNREEHPYVGTINHQGILVYVENEAGSIREGRDANGQPWRVKMRCPYGEIPGTAGSDGDPIDAYIGPNPSAPMAFVLHQRHYFGTEYEVPGTYDEDKVMLGFDTLEDAMRAYAAHYNHPVWAPGTTILAVDELKDMLEDGELSFGAALVKAAKPPGRGWQPIPKGKKGGWRRKGPDGKWQYRYATAAPTKPKLADEAERDKAMRARLEPDPARTTNDIKPGEIVNVGGREGRYKWVPGQKREGTTTTSVQSMSTGSVELVRRNTLVPLRTKRRAPPPPPPARAKRKAPPPPPPSRPAVRAGESVIPADWPGGPKTPPPATDEPSEQARKAKPWAHSTAKPGTALEAVENGSLMLQKFRGRHDKRMRLTIHVPDAMKEKLAIEMTPAFHKAARSVARSFRPPIAVVVPGTNELTSDYKELVAGAQLGFVMALTNYQGGRAFVPVVLDYATVYAAQAARGIRRGTALKERDLRALKGYIAARSRAANNKRARSGDEPSRDEIIDQWYVTKRMIFTGRGENLGNYVTKDKDGNERIVDQAHEQIPDEPWQVMTPEGKPEGKTYPGKKQLAAKMEKLLAGEDVADDEWLQQAPRNLLPNDDDLAMSAGTALFVRREVQSILGSMGEPHRTALAMRFGMHVPDDENPDALHAKKVSELKAMAKDRGLRVSGSRSDLEARILDWSAQQTRPGTKGYEASAAEVADALNMGANLSNASKGAKIRRVWKEALSTFQRKAIQRNAAIAEYVAMWTPDLREDPKPDERRHGPLLPSHSYLKDRFGTDERVYVYQAAMRAGTAQRTARMLEREKNNELSPAESNQLREAYHAQLRRDAQEAFNRYRAVTVDPDKVHEIGPQTGTPGEAEWLYTDNVLAGYMRALIRGGKKE